MYAEKDAWFQVGVSGSHPDKELTVYVHVEGVDVRIADAAFTEKIQYLNRWYDRSDLSEETIAWLEWYNSLTAYEQLAVSYRPYDLSDTDEKPSVVDAQPYDVTDEDEKPSVMETEETATPDSGQQKTELAAAIAAAIMEKNISSSPLLLAMPTVISSRWKQCLQTMTTRIMSPATAGHYLRSMTCQQKASKTLAAVISPLR